MVLQDQLTAHPWSNTSQIQIPAFILSPSLTSLQEPTRGHSKHGHGLHETHGTCSCCPQAHGSCSVVPAGSQADVGPSDAAASLNWSEAAEEPSMGKWCEKPNWPQTKSFCAPDGERPGTASGCQLLGAASLSFHVLSHCWSIKQARSRPPEPPS